MCWDELGFRYSEVGYFSSSGFGGMHKISKLGSLAGKMTKYYDIGFNLTDPMYQGIYNGKKYHESDIGQVLGRAGKQKVRTLLITGSSLQESRVAIQLCNSLQHDDIATYYTVGVHPCCVNEFGQVEDSTIENPTHDEHYNQLVHAQTIQDNSVAIAKLATLHSLYMDNLADPKFRAVGEIGLDYDRLYYSSKEMQKLFFIEQLKLSCMPALQHKPLFLHMRGCCEDFVGILKMFIAGFTDSSDSFQLRKLANVPIDTPMAYKFSPERKFVVHSFTDSPTDLASLLSLSPNCYIGMNGASLRNDQNILSAEQVPLDRLLLETDAPWCDIRPSHRSYAFLQQRNYTSNFRSVKRDKFAKIDAAERDNVMIKNRNEPCNIEQVAIVIANIKNIPLEKLAAAVWENSCSVYGE